MARKTFKVLWHEEANVLAIVDPAFGGLPLLNVCDDDFHGINPFYSYPVDFLKHFGWIEIGEL